MKKKLLTAGLVLTLAMAMLIPLTACEDPTVIPGGYTEDRAVTAEDLAIFEEALAGLLGVDYEPTLVATQIVAGTNYRFTATATVVYPDAEPYTVHIFIYQPLGDEPPVLVDIVEISG